LKENAMFKNHSLRIKFVKDAPESVNEEPTTPVVDPELIATKAKEIIKSTAVAGVAVIAATYALKTLNEVIVTATEAKVNKNRNN
jgi:hypothetical protein